MNDNSYGWLMMDKQWRMVTLTKGDIMVINGNTFGVGKTMPCLPPMTGNGKHSTFQNADGRGMAYYSLPTLQNNGKIIGQERTKFGNSTRNGMVVSWKHHISIVEFVMPCYRRGNGITIGFLPWLCLFFFPDGIK